MKIGTIILGVILIYLTAAFIVGDINFINWTLTARYFTGLFMWILIIAAAMTNFLTDRE